MELGPHTFGYCTNVHANASLALARANLEKHALGVKRRFSPAQPMGIGLWLSASAAAELVQMGRVSALADWLREAGLVPFTMNGFPQGDFHQPVVKHQVYKPTWWEPERLAYTLQLAEILDQLLPAGIEGSISTLPISWPPSEAPSTSGRLPLARELLDRAALQLRQLTRRLADCEARTGRLIYVCIEPEPGCVLDTADDIVHFFQEYLCRGDEELIVPRYLRVCHDICHSAVMFEDQTEALRKYEAAGIEVGKVQVSSAVGIDFDSISPPERKGVLEQFQAKFVEPRYLHQTCVQSDGRTTLYEDLPIAIDQAQANGRWRTHFHVPIYWEGEGPIRSTRDQIEPCIRAVLAHSHCRHFEVETYAWNVLPEELKQPELADGIAREMRWFQDQCANL